MKIKVDEQYYEIEYESQKSSDKFLYCILPLLAILIFPLTFNYFRDLSFYQLIIILASMFIFLFIISITAWYRKKEKFFLTKKNLLKDIKEEIDQLDKNQMYLLSDVMTKNLIINKKTELYKMYLSVIEGI